MVDTGSKLIAIECKWGKNAHEHDCKGLRILESLAKKPVEKYLVYTGTTRQKFSASETAVPYHEFLSRVLPTIQ